MTASAPDLTKLEAEMREKAARCELFGDHSGAAEAEHPSPWRTIPNYDRVVDDNFNDVARCDFTPPAQYIAASCPSNVIAVLDGKDAEIERLRQQLREALYHLHKL